MIDYHAANKAEQSQPYNKSIQQSAYYVPDTELGAQSSERVTKV